MLPLLPPQFRRISEALIPPQPPLVTPLEYASLLQFTDYWHNNWGVGGRFDGLWDHSENRGLRTTNVAEGFHTKIRAAFPKSTPTLHQMLDFIQNQLVIAKGMVGPAADGARPHYVRRDEEMRQLEVSQELSRFYDRHVIGGVVPSTRECKEFLDYLASRLAH